MEAAAEGATNGARNSLSLSELKALKLNEVNGWKQAEALRLKLQRPGSRGGRFSRAKLCQRAQISETTFFKGLKHGTAPSRRTVNRLRLALEGRRHELIEGIENREGV